MAKTASKTPAKKTGSKKTGKTPATKRADLDVNKEQASETTRFVNAVRSAGRNTRAMVAAYRNLTRSGWSVEDTSKHLRTQVAKRLGAEHNGYVTIGRIARSVEVLSVLEAKTGLTLDVTNEEQVSGPVFSFLNSAGRNDDKRDTAAALIKRAGDPLALTAADVNATGESKARLGGKSTGKDKGNGDPVTLDAMLTALVAMVDAIASGKADKGTSKGLDRWDEVAAHVSAAIAGLSK